MKTQTADETSEAGPGSPGEQPERLEPGMAVEFRKSAPQGESLLRQSVEATAEIRLTGMPCTLILDAGAILSPEGDVPPQLLAKLRVLALHERMRVIVLSPHERTIRSMLSGVDNLQVVPGFQDASIDGSALAILGEWRDIPSHVYAWYVGDGKAHAPVHPGAHRGETRAPPHPAEQDREILLPPRPADQDGEPHPHTRSGGAESEAAPSTYFSGYSEDAGAQRLMHQSRHEGGEAADEILGLFGTALVQERAGIAFRAAGSGADIPQEAPFDRDILDGISKAVTNRPVTGEISVRSRPHERDLDRDTDHIIDAALPAILSAQDENGAVAAAPPPGGPHEPNYWFFWQRDAGQVVLAMTRLGRESPHPHVQERARSFVRSYIHFVAELPSRGGIEMEDLGVSRFEMNGRPVRSYGNPQKDGPAHTVLAVTEALPEADAYDVCRPYLEYLSRYITGLTFDPWEFAVGEVFFTYNLARRALRRGARLAETGRDPATAQRYRARAAEIEHDLETFASPAEGRLLAGRSYVQPFLRTVSHLDIDVVGSILTAYDVDDPFLNVDHPLVTSTLKSLERAYADRWPVNLAWRRERQAGMGMGRFPEDMNDGIRSTGGSPWTFPTLWAAQYYLRLVQRRDALSTPDPEGRQRAELLDRADGYLQFILSHLSPEALTEQIDGRTGTPRGARALAWAQAALIETLLLRRSVRSASCS